MACEFKENILKFDRPVPRYTSYPTAPHFKALEDKEVPAGWFASVDEANGISLYIHIPFCQQMCWYCGCNTKVTRKYSPVESYLHLLKKEISHMAVALGGRRKVQSIHFGGGSPGIIEPQDFADLMVHIRQCFEVLPSAEVAIELDPRGVTESKIAVYAKSEVNRLSVGVQDFDEEVMASVNRHQPFHLTYNTVQLAREYGIEAINFDLIYGLPHQNVKATEQTIEKVLMLEPDRIAFFGYAHVPWMKKHMRLIDERALPDKSLRYDLFEVGERLLLRGGYQSVGIDHFAKPGDSMLDARDQRHLNRNFQGYTTDSCQTLLAIGASSIGQFDQGFIQNYTDMPHYSAAVENEELPVQKICDISYEDKVRSRVIKELMCYFDVDLNRICADFGLGADYFSDVLDGLKPYVEEGFVSIDGNVIKIEGGAKQTVRLVCAEFDSYFNPDITQKHAKAV